MTTIDDAPHLELLTGAKPVRRVIDRAAAQGAAAAQINSQCQFRRVHDECPRGRPTQHSIPTETFPNPSPDKGILL